MPDYKTKRVLMRPLLKFVKGEPHHVKIEAPMFIGREMKADDKKKQMEPATLVNVVNLDTGELCQIILAAVVKSVLRESYPDDAYVGLCFKITKQERQPGKKYDPFLVEEIEDPTGDAAPTPAAAPAAAKRKR
jgi:hypothetical protein